MFTKLQAQYPPNGQVKASYNVRGAEVTIFEFLDSTQTLYHLMPPEFLLSEELYELLDLARNVMAEHKPTRKDFVDPAQMREVFTKIGKDLLEDLAHSKGCEVSDEMLDTLTEILLRYTVGFGLIEVLLQDEKVQDISVNSPLGRLTIFIVHEDFGECYTNIIPTHTEAESWASKLRMISGRPLDESNQILDTELELPGASTRVSVITQPLDPTGLAYSFRRHRDKPWTLPLFIKYKMMNPLAAGIISFLIDGNRTILVAGTRSSGKSSVLGALLVEIMKRFRIITIEDTLELPCPQLQQLGFNIQQMKVAGALAKEGAEMTATDGIRATLRLGDSALFVGEVRSKEAISLYEAMRVGAAANVVAGTIHADSPYGVFDRVVNDIGVPRTSFKATDIIIVANPIKTASSLHKQRRITSITEIRKHWEQDPLAENGFVDLMKYDVNTDQLYPTQDLLNGDSEVLKTIAANIKGLAGNWEAVWNDITLRAQIKGKIVEMSDKTGNLDLLEAPFVIRSNDVYHNIVGRIQEQTGSLDTSRAIVEWEAWLSLEIKRMKEE